MSLVDVSIWTYTFTILHIHIFIVHTSYMILVYFLHCISVDVCRLLPITTYPHFVAIASEWGNFRQAEHYRDCLKVCSQSIAHSFHLAFHNVVAELYSTACNSVSVCDRLFVWSRAGTCSPRHIFAIRSTFLSSCALHIRWSSPARCWHENLASAALEKACSLWDTWIHWERQKISWIRFHRQKNHVGPFVPLVTFVTAVFGLVQRTMNADYLKTLLSNIEAKTALQQFCLSVSLPPRVFGLPGSEFTLDTNGINTSSSSSILWNSFTNHFSLRPSTDTSCSTNIFPSPQVALQCCSLILATFRLANADKNSS